MLFARSNVVIPSLALISNEPRLQQTSSCYRDFSLGFRKENTRALCGGDRVSSMLTAGDIIKLQRFETYTV